MQENQDQETSMDEVQSTRKYKKQILVGVRFLALFQASSGACYIKWELGLSSGGKTGEAWR